MDSVNDVIWTPSPEVVDRANVTRFMRRHSIGSYEELIRRTTADTSWFWEAALQDLGVRWSRPYTRIQDGSKGFPWTRWFVDGRLNIVANCLDPRDRRRPAIVWKPTRARSGSGPTTNSTARSAASPTRCSRWA